MEEPTATSRGLLGEGLSLWGSLGRHAHAVGELAAAEGREAAGVYLRFGIMLLAGLVLALFGYLLLLLSLAFVVQAVFHISWVWIAVGLAVLHILGAVVCALSARRAFQTPVFRATSDVLRTDFAALKGGSGSPQG